jgi:hypothetical protein
MEYVFTVFLHRFQEFLFNPDSNISVPEVCETEKPSAERELIYLLSNTIATDATTTTATNTTTITTTTTTTNNNNNNNDNYNCNN